MNTQTQELGFNRNHYVLMAVAVLVFAVLVIPQTGLKLTALFSQAEAPTDIVTYEQMRNEVYAKMDVGAEDEYLRELENQFALLDRGEADGAVLGEVIGLGEIPSIDQLYSAEQLNLIPVKINNETGVAAVQKYAERMLRLESYFNPTELYASLNSTDSAAIAAASKKVNEIVEVMYQLDVPQELADYHRYNILYYQTLGKLGTAFSSDDPNLGQYSQAMFSLLDKIGAIKSEVNSTYGATL